MSEAPAVTAPPLGLIARFVGVIFSPGATYAAVLRTPKPFGILFLVAVVIGLSAAVPQMTESGRQAMLDMNVQNIERVTGQPVTDVMYTAMERQSRFGAVLGLIATFVMLPIVALLVSGFLWGVFNAFLGGTESFKHVLTVVTHGMVIAALGTLAAMPVMMMQGTMTTSGPFNLGVLVPMLNDAGFPSRFLRATTVFGIWQTIVVGIGLAVLYRKSARSVSMGLLVVYALMTAVIVTVTGAFMNFGG